MNTTVPSRFRKRNQCWSRYNRALTQRGSITLYMGSDVEQKWDAGCRDGARGRPEVYPDAVIHLGLVLQQVYRLSTAA